MWAWAWVWALGPGLMLAGESAGQAVVSRFDGRCPCCGWEQGVAVLEARGRAASIDRDFCIRFDNGLGPHLFAGHLCRRCLYAGEWWQFSGRGTVERAGSGLTAEQRGRVWLALEPYRWVLWGGAVDWEPGLRGHMQFVSLRVLDAGPDALGRSAHMTAQALRDAYSRVPDRAVYRRLVSQAVRTIGPAREDAAEWGLAAAYLFSREALAKGERAHERLVRWGLAAILLRRHGELAELEGLVARINAEAERLERPAEDPGAEEAAGVLEVVAAVRWDVGQAMRTVAGERAWLGLARTCYAAAERVASESEAEVSGGNVAGRAQRLYLLGEMSRRLGDHKDAVAWFDAAEALGTDRENAAWRKAQRARAAAGTVYVFSDAAGVVVWPATQPSSRGGQSGSGAGG